jgi:protein SCO1/2
MSGRLLALLAAAATVAATSCRASPPHGVVIDKPHPAVPLVVTLPSGRPYELAADTGKFVLLYFGYTQCPDLCPMMLNDWARVKRNIGQAADRIRFVFVSVDPERDTKEGTAQFVQRFDSSFVGLAPTVAELETIKRAWEITVYKERSASPGRSAGQYSVAHPANAFLLDRAGRIRVLYPPETRWQDLAADLKRMF